jgi:hypothetical protein
VSSPDDGAAASPPRVRADQADDQHLHRFGISAADHGYGGLAKKDRITHRIPISSAAEINGDVKKWLQTAYDLDEV